MTIVPSQKLSAADAIRLGVNITEAIASERRRPHGFPDPDNQHRERKHGPGPASMASIRAASAAMRTRPFEETTP